MKLDALVIAAHPDDAEISLGGTILRMVDRGAKIGVIDLTQGEMGTRGTAELREREAAKASELLGLAMRRNLGLPDGRVRADLESRELLARVIREHRPDVLFTHHFEDLHPDHAACGKLVREAWYLSGLSRLAELDGGHAAHRPRQLFHFMGHVPFDPTVVIDVSDVWERKVAAIRCYASQLEPGGVADRGEHFLFGADVLERAASKARYFGERIGRRFGEPLLHVGPLAVSDPLGLR